MEALFTCGTVLVFGRRPRGTTLGVHVHILHAFIHTDEQRFRAIYRAAILAHPMCQLLLSKWPQNARATAGKRGGTVGRAKCPLTTSDRVCVHTCTWACDRLGAARHVSCLTGPQDIHVRKELELQITRERLKTHTHTHTHTGVCEPQQVEPVQHSSL